MKKDNILGQYIVFTLILCDIYYILIGISLRNTDSMGNFILFVTGIAIIIYTFETYKLRRSQQELNAISMQELLLKKKERVTKLIGEFNLNISDNVDYYLSPRTNKNDLFDTIRMAGLRDDFLTEAKRVTSFISYFEKAGLMVNEGIIDFDVFFRYFSVIFPKLYRDNTLIKIIEFYQGPPDNNKEVWADFLSLKDKFEERLSTYR